MGRPWEIYRQRGIRAPNRVTDYYTKDVDIGGHHTDLSLLPDYGVGFASWSLAVVDQGSFRHYLRTLSRRNLKLWLGSRRTRLAVAFTWLTALSIPLWFSAPNQSFPAPASIRSSQMARRLNEYYAQSEVPVHNRMLRLYPTNLKKSNETHVDALSLIHTQIDWRESCCAHCVSRLVRRCLEIRVSGALQLFETRSSASGVQLAILSENAILKCHVTTVLVFLERFMTDVEKCPVLEHHPHPATARIRDTDNILVYVASIVEMAQLLASLGEWNLSRLL